MPVKKKRLTSRKAIPPRGTQYLAWVLEKSPRVISRMKPDGSVVVLHLENNKHFFNLTGFSAVFWKSLNGKSSVEQIASRLLKASGLSAAVVERGVKRLVAELLKAKLVVKAGERAPSAQVKARIRKSPLKKKKKRKGLFGRLAQVPIDMRLVYAAYE